MGGDFHVNVIISACDHLWVEWGWNGGGMGVKGWNGGEGVEWGGEYEDVRGGMGGKR